MKRKWVYLFDEGEQAEARAAEKGMDVRGLLGGKGAHLAEMVRIGVPVPCGFTVTTEACTAYLAAAGIFPSGMWDQVLGAVKTMEKKVGKRFGDPSGPLLVSCRSGARFSMPGMMDTVLNVGLNDAVAEGLADLTGDARFAYDSYRRLIQMFGVVVMGMDDSLFETVIARAKAKAGVQTDAELTAADWMAVTRDFKRLFRRHAAMEFPEDPGEQLKMATEAVFKSWNGRRAIDYRNAAGIPHDLGTAVSIVTMVFGNMGDDCATGVAMTRNSSTGENRIEGDYLINAQGEDVVAGIRPTRDIGRLKKDMPRVWERLAQMARQLETHYRDMQDLEFTVEKGRLWMLQTRSGKRTAQAAVRIAVDMAREGLIGEKEAVLRVLPEQVEFFLHPQFDPEAVKEAKMALRMLTRGLNVSPGAAVGRAAFDADMAQTWARQEGRPVIMVRPETRPDDVHGMLAARGILTSRGGRTSHAALVARQFGKPAVVGAAGINIDIAGRQMTVGDKIVREGDWLSVDGTTGAVFAGRLATMVPDMKDPYLIQLLAWADAHRRLGVWANADYPKDARRALDYGAEGIGLCRSEHMFFEADRLPLFQQMIMTDYPVERQEALKALLPFQREDFAGLFRVMDGRPVIVRLIDPPLHEFLPDLVDLLHELADLKIRLQHADTLADIDALVQQLREKERVYRRAESLREANPMLGLRGVRLGIYIPELTTMQVRAIFEAACQVTREGLTVVPKVMIPLTSTARELEVQRAVLEKEARRVMQAQDVSIEYQFGTMIELPRAALTADRIAEQAAFFSFGTNDLTQTTFGISRDDAEAGFLVEYMETGILPDNPFATLDRDGVGQLMKIAIAKGRAVNPDLECGICGEHGGDPRSIALCHDLGLTYVSCSPFRVPIARLAAAHAALMADGEKAG